MTYNLNTIARCFNISSEQLTKWEAFCNGAITELQKESGLNEFDSASLLAILMTNPLELEDEDESRVLGTLLPVAKMFSVRQDAPKSTFIELDFDDEFSCGDDAIATVDGHQLGDVHNTPLQEQGQENDDPIVVVCPNCGNLNYDLDSLDPGAICDLCGHELADEIPLKL